MGANINPVVNPGRLRRGRPKVRNGEGKFDCPGSQGALENVICSNRA